MATKSVAKRTGAVPVQPAQVYYRINSLLYTLRSIAQREDQLCMLMHHLRTSGKLTGPLTAELHEILDEIPAQDYLHDLESLRASLEASGGAQSPSRVAKSRTGGKRRAA